MKIGEQYGEWTVSVVPKNAISRTKIPCRCLCGRAGTPSMQSLVRGTSSRCRSCGSKTLAARTAQKKNLVAACTATSKYAFIPRLYRSQLQHRVHSAIQRCYDPKNNRYEWYGGRGISVFPAWRENRVLFARYLMTLPGWNNPDLQIDRIDNEGNYEPGNLRFVTPRENCQNRRSA